VQPLLDGKKPHAWTIHDWAKRAGLNSPHAAYRYLKGMNISAENRKRLAKALNTDIPE
jgi:hypothetical protein